ncbi:MAG: tandem-95 repeat protein [bacterium]
MDNASQISIRFEVNSTAGDILVDAYPAFTLLDRINLTGQAEPYLSMELIREGQVLRRFEASPQGTWRVDLIPLRNGQNIFRIVGVDRAGNEATPAEVAIYRDIVPPSIEFVEPARITNESRPEILAIISDEGIGVNEESIQLSLDMNVIVNFLYADEILSYTPPEDLSEGYHLVTLIAADRLGNTPRTPMTYQFFVDTQFPIVSLEEGDPQNLLDDRVDTIQNRSPEIVIPIADPEPASGIVWDEISLTLDDEELEIFINPDDGYISYNFAEHDRELEEGEHELALRVEDYAGNEVRMRGRFRVIDVQDLLGPFFANEYPPPGGVVGAGIRAGDQEGQGMPQELVADTLRFVIGDVDAGVDRNTIRIWLNGQPFGENRFNVAPNGLVTAPLIWFGEEGARRMPVDIPGLEEGINFINAFGADNEGNENEAEWQFFFDATPPEPPVLEQPERRFVNRAEVTITGQTGEDRPEYEEGFQNSPTIRIYIGREIVAQQRVEYQSEFSVAGVLLNEGPNIIRATILDGGGNESEFSESIEIFLDLNRPVVQGFAAQGGRETYDNTPTFTAHLYDQGSGIDIQSLQFLLNDQEVEYTTEYDEEEGAIAITISDTLRDGSYQAILWVSDRAGNQVSTSYDFIVDTRVLPPPQFSVQPFTSVNRVVLTGESEPRTNVIVYLNDTPISFIRLGDEGTFTFAYTAPTLPDTSLVQLSAITNAGLEGERSESQLLVKDVQGPTYSDIFPGNGMVIEVSQLREIRVFIQDDRSGVDTSNIRFSLRGEIFEEWRLVGEERGIWLIADVSDLDFNDGEVVNTSISALDRSSPPNRRRLSWQFVTSMGDAPVVSIPDTSFNEDETFNLSLGDFISDPDHSFSELEVQTELIEGGDYASVEVDQFGQLTITPEPDWFGNLRLLVVATDPTGLEGSDSVNIRVLPVNDPPVIATIPDTVAFVGREFRYQVEATDVDPDDRLTFSDNSPLFDITEEGLIAFTPRVDQRGLYRTQVWVFDQAGESDTSEFFLFVTIVNQPVEVIGQIEDITIWEDAPDTVIANINEIFRDPDGQPLTYYVAYDREGVRVSISQPTGDIHLVPTPDFFGEVQVTITADDRAGSRDSVTFQVTVRPVNDAPRLVGILPRELVIDEDSGQRAIAQLDTVFTDVDGDELSFRIEGGEHLGVDIDRNNLLSINPALDWFGIESFQVIADDGVEGQDRGPVRQIRVVNENLGIYPAMMLWANRDNIPERDALLSVEVRVVVLPVNDAPRLQVDDPFEVEMDEDQEPLVIQPPIRDMVYDPDPEDEIRVSWEDRGGPVGLRFNEDQTHLVAFLREMNWFGEAEQTVFFIDRAGAYVTLTFHFIVNPVNDAPEVVQPIGDQTFDEDSGPWLVADLNRVFTDVDGDRLSYSIVRADEPLEATIDQQGRLIINIPENYNTANQDPLVVIVRADDGQGQGAIMNFRVDENAGWARINRQIREVDALGGNFNAVSQFGYRAVREIPPQRDDVIDDRFEVTIRPVNDEPYWVDVPEEVMGRENEEMRVQVRASDVDLDIEGDQLALRLVDDGGTVERGAQFEDLGDGVGQFIWTPGFDDAGSYQLRIEVQDRAGASVSAQISVLVGNVNRPPIVAEPISDIELDEDQEEMLAAELVNVFADPDREALSYEVPDPVGLNARLDEQGRLYIVPEPNWNGVTQVVVIARDSSQATARDTFQVTVRSINDLPTPFDLVSPRDSAYVITFPSVRFTWTRSVDVVEDSTVTYSLVLFYAGTRHWYTNLRDTTIRISRADLSIDPTRPTQIRWWVWANDKIDSIRSNQIFTLIVAPLTVQEDEGELLPKELTLGPIYPNPFNEVVTVRFDLPVEGNLEIAVIDQQGRTIATLAYGRYRPGRYWVQWNGESSSGVRVPSGVYFCRLRFGDQFKSSGWCL